MHQGRIKFFNPKGKFGFITDLNDGKEYYVHAKDLLSTVQEGDTVEYELKILKRGPAAINVRKIEEKN